MLSQILAVALIVFSPAGFASHSAQVVTIQGRVTAPGNKPIENARVILMNDSYSPLQTSYTNLSGRYSFKVGPGFYYIQIEPMESDLKRQQQRVDAMSAFGGNQLYNIDFSLKASASGPTYGAKPVGPIF